MRTRRSSASFTASAKLTLPFALTLVACGGGGAQTNPTTPSTSGGDANVHALEEEVLRDLATIDRRIAIRAGITPREEDLRRAAMGGVLAEDPTLGVVDGYVDPFSFEARARGLQRARARLDALPRVLPVDRTTRETGEARATAGARETSPHGEAELLVALVEEERARLDEERRLPRSASTLLRAVIATWPAGHGEAAIAERSRWLTRRLAEIGAAIIGDPTAGEKSAGLDVVRARELDDTLDAIEHLIDAPGYAQANAELVKLRDVLETQSNSPPAAATSTWAEVERSLRAHLGALPADDVLDAWLGALEGELRAMAAGTSGTAALADDPQTDEARRAEAAALVLRGDRCVDAVAGSRLRSLAAPPERAPGCHLRHAATAARDGAARAVVATAMHDVVIVGRWSLAVARGRATIADVVSRERPLSRPEPEVLSRWERIAIARPAVAIGAALSVAVTFDRADLAARARAYSALGDVPIDVAMRELPPLALPPPKR